MLPYLHLTFDISQEWNWKFVLDDGRSDRLLISPFTPIPAAHTEGAKKHLQDEIADYATGIPNPQHQSSANSGRAMNSQYRTSRQILQENIAILEVEIKASY